MGILGRGIEDTDKLLRAFGSEGVKGFVKWKEESPVVHKVYICRRIWKLFLSRKTLCILVLLRQQ